MLDEAGHEDCAIVVSNSLDEYLIRDILHEGACIDSFGVGERLITAKTEPVFGGVYKLSAIEKDGNLIPKIKVSENVEKITNPGFKSLFRLFDKDTDEPLADLITLDGETIPEDGEYEIFDPKATWKKKTVSNFYAVNLRKPIFIDGKCVYNSPSIDEIRTYCRKEMDAMWAEMKRLENPQTYYVDLSYELWKLKNDMLGNVLKEIVNLIHI